MSKNNDQVIISMNHLLNALIFLFIIIIVIVIVVVLKFIVFTSHSYRFILYLVVHGFIIIWKLFFNYYLKLRMRKEEIEKKT